MKALYLQMASSKRGSESVGLSATTVVLPNAESRRWRYGGYSAIADGGGKVQASPERPLCSDDVKHILLKIDATWKCGGRQIDGPQRTNDGAPQHLLYFFPLPHGQG